MLNLLIECDVDISGGRGGLGGPYARFWEVLVGLQALYLGIRVPPEIPRGSCLMA